MKFFKLNNGIEMPVIGLGTYPMKGEILTSTILKAIELGYCNFDTASAYGNHEAIGNALKASNVKREKIFITSKVSNAEQKNGNIEMALKKTLNYLKLEYLDLYLIHWPNPGTFTKSWFEMERLYEKGLVRAIGVCNFHEHHLDELFEMAKVIPTINQIELHPLLTQKPLIKVCENYDIKIEAYSPLARMNEKLMKNSMLMATAKKHNKTVPQIILRWNYQRGIISIPKTQNKERLNENIDIFDFSLSSNDTELIDNLNEDFRVRYNPDNCDFNKL